MIGRLGDGKLKDGQWSNVEPVKIRKRRVSKRNGPK